MYFKIGETLEHLSNHVILNQGDMILTGTPSGIGPIKIGDKLKGVMKQDGETIIEMSYSVEEEDN